MGPFGRLLYHFVLLKAEETITTESANLIEESDVQLSKAWSQISTTPSSTFSDLRFVLFIKALVPIHLTLFPIANDVTLLKPFNGSPSPIFSPKYTTLYPSSVAGIVTLVAEPF